jgi:hypothetical protein
MPSFVRVLAPFAAGVAAGVLLHKYWPQIREAGGPQLEKAMREGSRLFDKGREQFWEKSEKFADLVAEIREEEEARAKAPPPAPEPPQA